MLHSLVKFAGNVSIFELLTLRSPRNASTYTDLALSSPWFVMVTFALICPSTNRVEASIPKESEAEYPKPDLHSVNRRASKHVRVVCMLQLYAMGHSANNGESLSMSDETGAERQIESCTAINRHINCQSASGKV